jgi:hypothetical protein
MGSFPLIEFACLGLIRRSRVLVFPRLAGEIRLVMRVLRSSPELIFHRARAELLRRYIGASVSIHRVRSRRRILFEFVPWTAIILLGALSARPLQHFLSGKMDEAFRGLQTLIVTIGAAMIGATAIVASLVLFAMQVNVQRLPHGL